MKKNITLKLDQELLKRIRHLAVDNNQSVSAWVSELIVKTLSKEDLYEQCRREALEALEHGYSLGGATVSRDQLHERG